MKRERTVNNSIKIYDNGCCFYNDVNCVNSNNGIGC